MTNQEKELLNSFDKQDYIDWSKATSNEKELQSKVDSLQLKLDKANILVEAHEKTQEQLLSDISKLTSLLTLNNEETDKVDEEIKKTFKSYLSGIHMNSQIHLQEFNYRQINFSLNLKYNISKFFIGLNAQTISLPNTKDDQRDFIYSALIGYNIF